MGCSNRKASEVEAGLTTGIGSGLRWRPLLDPQRLTLGQALLIGTAFALAWIAYAMAAGLTQAASGFLMGYSIRWLVWRIGRSARGVSDALAAAGAIALYVLIPSVRPMLFAIALGYLTVRTIHEARTSAQASFAFAPVLISWIGSMTMSESLAVTAISGVGLLLALIAMHSSVRADLAKQDAGDLWGSAGTVVLACALTAPAALALFYVYPRFPTGLSNPAGGGAATTGMDWKMTPGSVSDLVKSNRLAFIAEFKGQINQEPSQLYWKAAVFDRFDGKTWVPAASPARGATAVTRTATADTAQSLAISYQVLLPKSLGEFMPVLDGTRGTIVLQDAGASPVVVGADHLGVYRNKLTDRGAARAMGRSSDLSGKRPGTPALVTAEDLALPAGLNPRTIELAKKWRDEIGENDELLINKLKSHIRDGSFYYTLSPPIWEGSHGVDEFWFRHRSGFCEHYAGASAVLLRAAGIPSRVVTGFQGGDIAADQVQVLSRDAHAWLEVMVSGQWQRFDPTSSIHPSRVEAQTRSIRQRASDWRTSLQALAQKIASAWDDHVVRYDYGRQGELRQWLRTHLRQVLAWSAAALALLTMGGYALVLLRRRRAQAMLTEVQQAAQLWPRLIARLQRDGWPAADTMSVTQVRQLLGNAAANPRAQGLLDWLDRYERVRYGPPCAKPQQTTSLLRALRREL